MNKPSYRIGIGYDIHRLDYNRKLIIGGVNIPYERGLVGHSDGDVLIHAIIDAILGALALPDIGTLFPDTDAKYKDIDSTILLKKIAEKISQSNYYISNIDCNIIAQTPKMMPYIPEMKSRLGEILGMNINNISIKAKTKENLDSVGESKGIEAQAVVLLSLV